MLILPALFQHGMVFQRNIPITIWGTAAPGQTILADFDGSHAQTTVCKNQTFQLQFPPHEAAEGLSLSIRCQEETDTRFIRDISVGEVWIASGQSNMEFPLYCDQEYQQLSRLPQNPRIHFFDVPRLEYHGQEQLRDFSEYGVWRTDTPKERGWFTSVGYFFAQKLFQEFQVPVAVIGCNFGSTSAACWIPKKELCHSDSLRHLWEEYEHSTASLDLTEYQAFIQKREAALRTGQMTDFTIDLYRNHRTADEIQALTSQMDPVLFEKRIGPCFFKRPGGLFETMVSTLIPYGMRGVLWYQGESDDFQAPLYEELLTTLITAWRTAWNREFPFLVVELADFDSWNGVNASRFPAIRAAQKNVAEKLSDIRLIDSTGAGDPLDIHPKSKRLIGERLAETALAFCRFR